MSLLKSSQGTTLSENLIDVTLEDMEDDGDNENVTTVREASSMAQSLWHIIMNKKDATSCIKQWWNSPRNY
jgi:hypothetical protein